MDIQAHRVGTWQTWHFGLVCRDVYRISTNKFEINCAVNGWHIAIVNKNTIQKLYNGQKSLLSLNWE